MENHVVKRGISISDDLWGVVFVLCCVCVFFVLGAESPVSLSMTIVGARKKRKKRKVPGDAYDEVPVTIDGVEVA